jgi:hypothetical protein
MIEENLNFKDLATKISEIDVVKMNRMPKGDYIFLTYGYIQDRAKKENVSFKEMTEIISKEFSGK